MTMNDEQQRVRMDTLVIARRMLETRRRRDGIESIPGDMARRMAVIAAEGTGITGTDLEWVIRELEADHIITVDEVQLIVPHDAAGPWTAPMGPLRNDLHDLLAQRGWGARVIQNMQDSTESILSRCGNPADSQPWQRRGLVVGQVQSGKTTSYTALIAGAVDAGYRNIVVLTGRTNDLRHQTQERIDEAIVGQESSLAQPPASARARGSRQATERKTTSAERPRVVGVGHIRLERKPGETWVTSLPPLLSLTSQDHRSGGTSGGDFNIRRAEHNPLAGKAITLAVSKKNGSVIKNLTRWLDRSGRINDGPLLVIDDEADDASIDVSPNETPSTINRAIRTLLRTASRASYVAYTATPYASIMIDPDADNADLGSDLFPGDFIALLDAPKNYMGAQAFLRPESDIGRNRNHFEEVTDTTGWIERGEAYGAIPGSMERAVQEFVAVTAARRARAHRNGLPVDHASMLIHCDVHVDVQHQITEEIADLIPEMRSGWQFPVGSSSHRGSIENAWLRIAHHQDNSLAVAWEDIEPLISGVLDDLHVEEINGSTKQTLDYRRAATENRTLTVIAVGGQKLSRGLTLEGLTTSYQLRITKLYDTLMQMGRWFGYRRGYEDLCRVHTTAGIMKNFLLVEEADEQLRNELRELQELRATPRDVGMRVRHNPGMEITGSAKLRNASRQRSGWSGRTIELTWFRPDDGPFNDQVAGEFLDGLGETTMSGNRAIWSDVSVEAVMELLEKHREPPVDQDGVRVGRVEDAMHHIRVAQEVDIHKLATWRVVLAGVNPVSPQRIGQYGVTRARRQGVGTAEIRIKVISDPKDEQLAVGAGSQRIRSEVKKTRDPNQGLLIGYPLLISVHPDTGQPEIPTFSWVVSFPPDHDIQPAEYVVNVRAQEHGI
jgi:Z1 domain